MEKRGQATLFVIIGIIIFVIVALFLYARQTILLPTTTENLNRELSRIYSEVRSCLDRDTSVSESANTLINRMALQGGKLNPHDGTYRLYNDNEVSYLCFNMINSDVCRNAMLLKTDMENELKEASERSLRSCINRRDLGGLRPYSISAFQEAEVNVVIRSDNVLFEINYPITLQSTRDSTTVSGQGTSYVSGLPLGRLYDVSQDILDAETSAGEFDNLGYMLKEKGAIRVKVLKPYPDKIYIINKENDNFKFQFAVQGEVA